MRTSLLLCLLSFSCNTEKTTDNTSSDDSSTDTTEETGTPQEPSDTTQEPSDTTDTEVEIPNDTYGTLPTTDIGVPTFSATNSDGSSRNQDNLIGQPTVMWFFPLAATPG